MSGTKKTKAQLISDLDLNINTNGVQAITGAVLNQWLNDLIESIFFGTKVFDRAVAVTSSGTAVSFSETLPSSDYTVTFRCYDANGDNVDARISNRTATGFTCTSAMNAFLDYMVITTDV